VWISFILVNDLGTLKIKETLDITGQFGHPRDRPTHSLDPWVAAWITSLCSAGHAYSPRRRSTRIGSEAAIFRIQLSIYILRTYIGVVLA